VTEPLPAGFAIVIDADTKQLDRTTLFGGSPARVMRLSASGAAAWQELRAGPVRSRPAAALARRLTDAGLAHPRPPATIEPLAATVLIPVHDRPVLLERCLTALGHAHPVVIVDDASADPDAVAAVAARHGARLLRRDTNRGPAAARDTGLDQVDTEFVAFLDSDCAPPPRWIDDLAAHFADPLVAAVAPRVVAVPSGSAAGRYAAAFGSLDLGAREARVVPSSRVAYVPTAALLVRRRAVDDVAVDGTVFDPALRYGEDVDLVWRLHEAGWRIRYDPTVRVEHREPDTWPALLARRFRYGTSAAPLTLRHPAAMRPLVLHAGPTATVAALLARRPLLALAAFIAYVAGFARTLHRARIPANGRRWVSADAVRQTGIGVGRYLCQFAAPLLLVGVLRPGRRNPWGRRASLAVVLLSPALTPARARGLGLRARVLARLADDIAYGAGVLAGCTAHRTVRPLVPAFSFRPLRVATVRPQGTERRTS
jgi:mycofactocin system glycosyltransferase